MTTELEKLLPCPFCGGRPHLMADEDKIPFIVCLHCPLELTGMEGEQIWSVEKLIKHWNTRAPSARRLGEEEIKNLLCQLNFKKAPEWLVFVDKKQVDRFGIRLEDILSDIANAIVEAQDHVINSNKTIGKEKQK